MDSILIVAGESSGERYGAALIREFRTIRPDASFFGIGGTQMAAEGVDLIFGVEQLSVMGLFEVIAHVPRISGILARITAEARSRKPAAAVLIDSPDFNLRLAKKLKKMGIPVLYYISPTVWAWRKNRLKTIRKYVDLMMLIFPFEKKIYEEANIPAVFLGHPLLERVASDTEKEEIFDRYSLEPDKPLIALLPGSRKGEIEYHASVLAKAAKIIEERIPVQFVLIQADGLDAADLARPFEGLVKNIQVIDHDAYNLMAASDLVISACGTANLETALLGTPLVAFYRVSPLTYFAGRPFVKIGHYSIVNILAGKEVVPELIQKEFTPEAIAGKVIEILDSESIRSSMKEDFLRIRKSLGDGHASKNAALELRKFLTLFTTPG